jgi:hypothetical protein
VTGEWQPIETAPVQMGATMRAAILAAALILVALPAMGQTCRAPDGTIGVLTLDIPGHTQCVTAQGDVIMSRTLDSYRLITQTYGGRIDILSPLTEEGCERMRLKALQMPSNGEERIYAKRFADEQKADREKETRACIDNKATCVMSPFPTYTITAETVLHAICEKQP